MKKTEKIEFLLNCVMATFLTLMGLFVFTNVILRYFFNSGLVWAEELSRFLFVWLVFIGAIGALKDNHHLGFTSLVQRLPPLLKKVCFIISNMMVVGCLWILFQGSWAMTMLTTDSLAPASEVPLAYMYSVGILSSVLMFAIICFNLYQAILVKGAIDTLVVLRESEEEGALQNEDKGEIIR